MRELSLSDLLPTAPGIALSPFPIGVVILLLLGSGSIGTASEPSQSSLIIQVLLGVLLLAAAFKPRVPLKDTRVAAT